MRERGGSTRGVWLTVQHLAIVVYGRLKPQFALDSWGSDVVQGQASSLRWLIDRHLRRCLRLRLCLSQQPLRRIAPRVLPDQVSAVHDRVRLRFNGSKPLRQQVILPLVVGRRIVLGAEASFSVAAVAHGPVHARVFLALEKPDDGPLRGCLDDRVPPDNHAAADVVAAAVRLGLKVADFPDDAALGRADLPLQLGVGRVGLDNPFLETLGIVDYLAIMPLEVLEAALYLRLEVTSQGVFEGKATS